MAHIDLETKILNKNDEGAAANRALLDEKGVYMVNVLASPGSGKTSTIVATINALRDKYNIAVIEGDIASDVDSQTIKALGVTEDVTKMPVLRPLIGTDKVEIIRMAREIGTYETSILPYEDCCTVFTPRHPCTRPKLEDVRAAEAALDVDALVAEALEGRQWVWVKPGDAPRI